MNDSLSVSQNFLIDAVLVAKLVKQSKLGEQDTVIDIGAGKGIITFELAKVCKKVIALELDYLLYKNLVSMSDTFANIEVLNQDFMSYKLPKSKYAVFSNIPFNLTSDIVYKLILSTNPPEVSYLIMQEEAALRFLGKGEGTMVSLLFRPFFDMEIVHTFNQYDFEPKPDVNAVLLKMAKRSISLIQREKEGQYRDFMVYIVNQQKSSIKLRLNKVFSDHQLIRLSKDLSFSLFSKTTDLSLTQWLGLFNYYCTGVDELKKRKIRGSFIKYLSNKKKQPISHRTKSHTSLPSSQEG